MSHSRLTRHSRLTKHSSCRPPSNPRPQTLNGTIILTSQKYLISIVLRFSNSRNSFPAGPTTVRPIKLLFTICILIFRSSDLLSTLIEAGGDVTLAVARITEGYHLPRITLSFHSYHFVRPRRTMGHSQKGQKILSSNQRFCFSSGEG
jgi:hypothetical protein